MGNVDGLGNPLDAALTYPQAVAAAYAAGFRGNALVSAVAISKRESGFVDNNYNGNTSTGDNSVGMMQINIIGGSQGYITGILQNLGYEISDRNSLIAALNDPITNFRVAYQMSNGGSTFYDWGGYKGMSPLYDTDVPAAQAAVNSFLAESSQQQMADIASIGVPSGSNASSGSTKQCPDAGSFLSASWFANRLCQFGFAPKVGTTDNGTQSIQSGNEVGGDRTTTAFQNILDGFGNVLSWITDYHNWIKLGVILSGGLLILAGIYTATKSQGDTVATG